METMGKEHRFPPQRVEEDKKPQKSARNAKIHNCSEKEFRDEIVRVLNVLKETMEERRANKIQEDMRTKIRKYTNGSATN